MHPLEQLLRQRIAIIDGAMGTTIRSYGMKEADIRGERFKDSKKDLLNNGDLFSLTQPKMICDIHRRFLEAGADIIETNTFSATSIGQSEFFVDDPREHGGRKDPAFYQKIIEDKFLNDLAWEINEQSARQCREWADRVANADGKQRFVAGAIGPLTVSLSNSPDADDAGFRVVTFDQVKAAYVQQVRALIAGGSDVLLVETIFDSLNAKAALVAIQEVFEKDGKRLPIMISAAVGRGGETMISAQTVEAFWNAVKHVKPLSVGLNCSLGPDLMRPFLAELATKSGAAISCYPNAGLPNPLSPTGFDLEPEDMGRFLGEFAQERLGQHRGRLLRQHARAHRGDRESARRTASARTRSPASARGPRRSSTPCRTGRTSACRASRNRCSAPPLRLAAVHAAAGRLHHDRRAHERRRLAEVREADQGGQIRGSRRRRAPAGRERRQRHRHLHGRGDDRRRRGDDALPATARQRAGGREGAVHGGLLEVGGHRGRPEMPAGQGHRELDLAQGRRGEVPRARAAPCCATARRSWSWRSTNRARRRLTRRRSASASAPTASSWTKSASRRRTSSSIRTSSPSATGIEEHNNYAVDFIEATRWIKANLPHAKVSGGVSNISFSFRGNNDVREAMHSAFLYHAIQAGMDMGIVNAGMLEVYEEIEPELRELVEDVLLNRRPDATERLVEFGEKLKAAGAGTDAAGEKKEEAWRKGTVEERLAHALVKGIDDYIDADTEEARAKLRPAARRHRRPAHGRHERRRRPVRRGKDVPAAGREVRARDEESGRVSHAVHGSGEGRDGRARRSRAGAGQDRARDGEGRRARHRQEHRRRRARL